MTGKFLDTGGVDLQTGEPRGNIVPDFLKDAFAAHPTGGRETAVAQLVEERQEATRRAFTDWDISK